MRLKDRAANVTGGGSGIGSSACVNMAKPDGVAWVVIFLASDEAEFITGSSPNVSGGREIH
jgi:NAD(P)-dependent dehydrogenase (short-subunit alcohol dehydrogenase family)